MEESQPTEVEFVEPQSPEMNGEGSTQPGAAAEPPRFTSVMSFWKERAKSGAMPSPRLSSPSMARRTERQELEVHAAANKPLQVDEQAQAMDLHVTELIQSFSSMKATHQQDAVQALLEKHGVSHDQGRLASLVDAFKAAAAASADSPTSSARVAEGSVESSSSVRVHDMIAALKDAAPPVSSPSTREAPGRLNLASSLSKAVSSSPAQDSPTHLTDQDSATTPESSPPPPPPPAQSQPESHPQPQSESDQESGPQLTQQAAPPPPPPPPSDPLSEPEPVESVPIASLIARAESQAAPSPPPTSDPVPEPKPVQSVPIAALIAMAESAAGEAGKPAAGASAKKASRDGNGEHDDEDEGFDDMDLPDLPDNPLSQSLRLAKEHQARQAQQEEEEWVPDDQMLAELMASDPVRARKLMEELGLAEPEPQQAEPQVDVPRDQFRHPMSWIERQVPTQQRDKNYQPDLSINGLTDKQRSIMRPAAGAAAGAAAAPAAAATTQPQQ